MTQSVSKPIEIPKEKIKNVKFSEIDVLGTKEEKNQRKIDLQRAATLGAQSKANIKIYFVDDQGKRHRVVATVWATTENNVSFKGEVMVPIKSIYQVGFF
jgi:hypothetical protein